MSPLDEVQTHALTREVLESLWDLQDLHRDLVQEVTRLASMLETDRTAKTETEMDHGIEMEMEPVPGSIADVEPCYQPV